jgi:hypothetical protein
MFPVATNGGGNCAAFPDVCKTPTPAGPVPIPYPNMAQCTDGEGSKKVKADSKEVLRKGDQIRMSAGDEAGSAQGVASNKIKGKCEYMMGWPTVKAEGKEVAHLTAMTGQNCGSPQNTAPGVQVAPGQTKVIVMVVKGVSQNVTVKVQKYHPEGQSDVPPNAAMNQNAQSTGNAGASSQDKRRASEAIGDEGARNAAGQLANDHGGLGSAPPGLNNPHSFSGAGTVDVIAFCSDGTVLVMEAKGGGSPLGTRNVPGVGRCQQGTPQYMQNIADNMAKSNNPQRAAAGKRLQQAIEDGDAKYYEARTAYDENGCENTTIKEFDP